MVVALGFSETCARRTLAVCVCHHAKTARRRRWRRRRWRRRLWWQRTGFGASAAQKRQEAQEVQPAKNGHHVGVARAVGVARVRE